MTNLDELIAEARRLEGDYSDNYEVVTHMSVLADALETAGAERDAALARIAELEDSEGATLVQPCKTHHELPYDFEQCETHDRTFPIGGKCDNEGLSYVDYQDRQHMLQRARAVKAEARIEELEQSLRIASLGRRVDATLLHEYERRFAEAAKLHRREPGTRVGWCSHCIDNDGPWPCPTAVALGLNEGESDDE